MPTVRANGIDISFEREGRGPRVLFLNGSGATIEMVRPLLPVFTDRADLLIYDQRGLGRTEIPPGPYTMADYAQDALALMDAVGWTTAHLVGISFGGMVAQELAVTAPERAERLALLCTSSGGGGGSSYPLHELVDLDPAERARRRPQLTDTRFTDEWLDDHPRDRRLMEATGSDHAPGDPERLRGEIEQLNARRRHDVWDRLPAISCPTLVACGRYDGTAPAVNSAAIASCIPDAELHTFEGGHLFFIQDRAALPTVLDFLTRP